MVLIDHIHGAVNQAALVGVLNAQNEMCRRGCGR